MTKPILDDKRETEHFEEILEEQTVFYEKLYASRKPKLSEKFRKTFFPDNREHIPVISENEKASCEGQ